MVFRLRRKTEEVTPVVEVIDNDDVVAADPEQLQDERLVRAAQSGDLPSFNALVVRHERPVYAVCFRILREVTSAEDATQDTFVKAWSSLSTFRGGLVRPWLLKIATNRCYDIIRARNRRPADSLDAEIVEVEPRWTSQASNSEEPESFATRVELSGFLEQALAQLPDDQRIVIVLSDVQGHTYEEIADITGVAVGTVKSRISRSRSKLREVISADPAAREHFDRFLRLHDR